MAVTQQKIADKLGLSRQAIAFAVSENPAAHRQLRPETRRRILETARRMGYVPHQAARRLVRSRSDVDARSFDQVGLISLGPSGGFDLVCLAMMGGAEQEVSKLRASVTFVRVDGIEDWEKVDRLTQSSSIDGWLVYGAADDAVVSRLRRTKLPFVIMGDHRASRPVHCVSVDNVAVGRLAAQHLVALGHRRIAFLGGGLKHAYDQQTLAGFRAEATELGLDDDPELVHHVGLWDRWEHAAFYSPRNAELLRTWLRDTGATAVFGAELDFAEALHRVMEQQRIAVPEQISILGYEMFTQGAAIRNFTRIELPLTEVGRRTALLLHETARAPGAEPVEVGIQPSIVQGWSTGPVRP